MQKYVADASVTTYQNKIVQLMLWLFDENPKKYFHDWIVGAAMTADEQDKELAKTRKTRKYLRQVFKTSLQLVEKNHCPLVLEAVDFTTFLHYVTTRKKSMEHFFQRVHTVVCRVL